MTRISAPLAGVTNVFSQVRIAGNPLESVGADVPEAIHARIYRESKRGFVQEFCSSGNTREPSSRYVNRAAFRAIFRQPASLLVSSASGRRSGLDRPPSLVSPRLASDPLQVYATDTTVPIVPANCSPIIRRNNRFWRMANEK